MDSLGERHKVQVVDLVEADIPHMDMESVEQIAEAGHALPAGRKIVEETAVANAKVRMEGPEAERSAIAGQ